ncbi:unannotated protein [freshwater metagenome]|uniref:Unannotated protein n=1 Tax=freshwater metagenome TaxID=449393 RepID=A0A6J7ATI1_9ZZZZ
MLERTIRFVVLVAGDVRLLVGGHDAAIALDQRLHVPAATRIIDGGVAEAEADAETLGLIEQRLRGRVRHAALVPVVGLADVVDEPTGEERGEREFGEHHQFGAHAVRLLQQSDQPDDHLLAGVLFLHGTHLGCSDSEVTCH